MRSVISVLLTASVLAPAAGAQARPAAKAAPEKAPVPIDTSVSELPAGTAGSSYGAVLKHVASAGPGGFYLIRLPADSLCEDHPLKPAWDEGRGQVKVVLDGGHSNATPGIELACGRRIVGGLTATAPSGEKFRASRIVEHGSFVMPAESELRWQSHFDVSVAVPAAEGLAATKRFAYYMVVEPVMVGNVGPAQRDSTHDAATLDAPDDITRVQQTLWSKHVWLWVVDRPSGKVLAKGPLLPGSCP